MFRVNVGMQQADRDRLRLAGSDIGNDVGQRPFVDWLDHRTVRRNAFANPEAPFARHQRRRLLKKYVVNVEFLFTCDIEKVRKSLGRDQGRRCAPAFDQLVADQCRRVKHDTDLIRRCARFFERRHHGFDCAAGGIVGLRQGFITGCPPTVRLKHVDVGECATDIQSDNPADPGQINSTVKRLRRRRNDPARR